MGEGRFASFRQCAEIFGPKPLARLVIKGNGATHRFFIIFADQRHGGAIYAGRDDGHFTSRLCLGQVPAGSFVYRHLSDPLRGLLQETGGEFKTVGFGEILLHFTSRQRTQFEAEDFRQQGGGRAKGELTVGLQGTEGFAPAAGLVGGTGDTDRAIERQVVPRTVGLAVPLLPSVVQARGTSHFACQELASEFLPHSGDQVLHLLFALIEAAALKFFPVHVSHGNGELLCFSIRPNSNLHLRPSEWFVVAATNQVKLSSRGPILLALLNFALHQAEFTPW